MEVAGTLEGLADEVEVAAVKRAHAAANGQAGRVGASQGDRKVLEAAEARVAPLTFIIIVELLKNSSLCLGLAFRCETYLYIFWFVTFFVDLLLPVLSQGIQSLQL